MALKHLIHPAKIHWPLAVNAGNTTIELSATHSTELNDLRLAYGGSVRILIYKPATVASSTPYFETVLIGGAPIANVFTVTSMTNEAQYTTANGASVSPNLVYDGEMGLYST